MPDVTQELPSGAGRGVGREGLQGGDRLESGPCSPQGWPTGLVCPGLKGIWDAGILVLKPGKSCASLLHPSTAWLHCRLLGCRVPCHGIVTTID